MAPGGRRPVVSEVTCRDLELSDGGDRLEAVWIGPAPDAAPTLVFLHEGLGCVALWRDIPARLVEMTGCGALVYSRLGYGASAPCTLPRPVDFMHHEGRVVLPEVIRQCGIRDHLLIGHSDGGSIALINAGGEPRSRPGRRGHPGGTRFLRSDHPAVHFKRHAGDTLTAISRRAWLSITAKTPTARSGVGTMSGCIRISCAGTSRNSCRPSRCRCWRFKAGTTRTGTMAQVDAIQGKAGGPVTVQRVPGCGHAPHLEQPDSIIPAISQFVRQSSPSFVRRRFR